MPLAGLLVGLGSALCWGLTSLLIREKARRANVVVLNALLLSVSTALLLLVLAALALLGRHQVSIQQPLLGAGLLLLSALLGFTVGNLAYVFALRWLGVSRALPLSLVQPVFAALLAIFLLGERFTLGL